VFLGLFSTPMPQGRPVACAVLAGPGEYPLAAVPDGLYYVMAAGVPATADPRQCCLLDTVLRGGGQALSVAQGAVTGMPHILLREKDPLDPPILMALPSNPPRAPRARSVPAAPAAERERAYEGPC
jgi:hypothetical protein